MVITAWWISVSVTETGCSTRKKAMEQATLGNRLRLKPEPPTARTMRRMEKVTGRSDDMIILRGVNVFPTQIEEQILKCAGLAPHFQIELVRKGRMDDMVVHVEAAAEAAGAEARAASAKELAHHIKSVVGVSTKVEVHDPDSVQRSEGKAKRVVDNRPKE